MNEVSEGKRYILLRVGRAIEVEAAHRDRKEVDSGRDEALTGIKGALPVMSTC